MSTTWTDHLNGGIIYVLHKVDGSQQQFERTVHKVDGSPDGGIIYILHKVDGSSKR